MAPSEPGPKLAVDESTPPVHVSRNLVRMLDLLTHSLCTKSMSTTKGGTMRLLHCPDFTSRSSEVVDAVEWPVSRVASVALCADWRM
jgi:hypothetical protein